MREYFLLFFEGMIKGQVLVEWRVFDLFSVMRSITVIEQGQHTLIEIYVTHHVILKREVNVHFGELR